jgi:uracil-DNA glycosylase family 4
VNDDVRAHFEFFAELGVDGLRLERAWRSRPDQSSRPAPESIEAIEAEPRPPEPIEASQPRPTAPVCTTESSEMVRVFTSSTEALASLRAEIGPDCQRCKLHTLGRKQVVFGVGNPDADLMFVGEAPGGDEDIQGEPFVGRAGQLLTRIIEAIGMQRSDVYIANVIKCRPPGNRNPEPDEVERCEPFLFRQIDLVKPKVIVALGKFAAQSLLKTSDPITRLRGREYRFRSATLIPTFHPAYLLRNPSSKREVWEDMKKVRALLTQHANE